MNKEHRQRIRAEIKQLKREIRLCELHMKAMTALKHRRILVLTKRLTTIPTR